MSQYLASIVDAAYEVPRNFRMAIGTDRVREVLHKVYEETRTQQQFSKDADVNTIMAKYCRTGVLGDPMKRLNLRFGDFSSGVSFKEQLDMVTDAQRRFCLLPSELRNRFSNDVSRLLDFVDDPENKEEAQKLGLLEFDPVDPAPSVDSGEPDPVPPEPAPATSPAEPDA